MLTIQTLVVSSTIHLQLNGAIISGEQFAPALLGPFFPAIRVRVAEDPPRISHHVSHPAPAGPFPDRCGSVSSGVRSRPSEGGGSDLDHFADSVRGSDACTLLSVRTAAHGGPRSCLTSEYPVSRPSTACRRRSRLWLLMVNATDRLRHPRNPWHCLLLPGGALDPPCMRFLRRALRASSPDGRNFLRHNAARCRAGSLHHSAG